MNNYIPYTVFIIKNDAIRRKLSTLIIEDIKKYLDILKIKNIVLSIEQVIELKKFEWENRWNPPPSDHVKELTCIYEAQQAIALFCMSSNEIDAISIGTELKGKSPLAHLCSPSTIRGKYYDPSIVSRISTDKHGVSLLMDNNRSPISYPPNVIHSVSDTYELLCHVKLLFPEFLPQVTQEHIEAFL